MDPRRAPWYVAGLHFECTQCGNCCAGPNEGYIWVTAEELEAIAGFLKMPLKDLQSRYVQKVNTRMTIVEEPRSKDCIFLRTSEGSRHCALYPVRPTQCRTWPFWPTNLGDPDAWNRAAQRCPGINRGRLYTYEQIEQLKE